MRKSARLNLVWIKRLTTLYFSTAIVAMFVRLEFSLSMIWHPLRLFVSLISPQIGARFMLRKVTLYWKLSAEKLKLKLKLWKLAFKNLNQNSNTGHLIYQ